MRGQHIQPQPRRPVRSIAPTPLRAASYHATMVAAPRTAASCTKELAKQTRSADPARRDRQTTTDSRIPHRGIDRSVQEIASRSGGWIIPFRKSLPALWDRLGRTEFGFPRRGIGKTVRNLVSRGGGSALDLRTRLPALRDRRKLSQSVISSERQQDCWGRLLREEEGPEDGKGHAQGRTEPWREHAGDRE